MAWSNKKIALDMWHHNVYIGSWSYWAKTAKSMSRNRKWFRFKLKKYCWDFMTMTMHFPSLIWLCWNICLKYFYVFKVYREENKHLNIFNMQKTHFMEGLLAQHKTWKEVKGIAKELWRNEYGKTLPRMRMQLFVKSLLWLCFKINFWSSNAHTWGIFYWIRIASSKLVF